MAKSSRTDAQRLADIVLASQTVQGLLEDIEKDFFLTSDIYKGAVQYQMIIIGEASAHISTELRNRHPEIEWQEMTDFRNIVVHGYFSVDWNIVWDAATRDVVELEEKIIKILETDFPEFWG